MSSSQPIILTAYLSLSMSSSQPIILTAYLSHSMSSSQPNILTASLSHSLSSRCASQPLFLTTCLCLGLSLSCTHLHSEQRAISCELIESLHCCGYCSCGLFAVLWKSCFQHLSHNSLTDTDAASQGPHRTAADHLHTPAAGAVSLCAAQLDIRHLHHSITTSSIALEPPVQPPLFLTATYRASPHEGDLC